MQYQFLRIADVQNLTGLPESTIFRWVATGKFPKPIKLGPRAVGWLQSEVADWQREKITASGRKVA